MKETDIHTAEGFAEAYDAWADRVFGFLCARLGDRERARDLTQETFMRTWAYIAEGKTVENIRPFLFTVANNLFKNELRAKRPVLSLDRMMEETAFEPADQGSSSATLADSRRAMASVEGLKPEYREVLHMRYVDGLSVSEIAGMVGASASAVSVRLHRAMHKLRTVHEQGA